PVSLKVPAARSACVIACVPVQTTVALGARLATGDAGVQLKLVNAGVSVTVTLVGVMLTGFFAGRWSVTVWPFVVYFAGFRSSLLLSASFFFSGAVILSGASSSPTRRSSDLPVSLKVPAARSACVIACVPVQTTIALGARLATGDAGVQLKLVNAGVSVTVTL